MLSMYAIPFPPFQPNTILQPLQDEWRAQVVFRRRPDPATEHGRCLIERLRRQPHLNDPRKWLARQEAQGLDRRRLDRRREDIALAARRAEQPALFDAVDIRNV